MRKYILYGLVFLSFFSCSTRPRDIYTTYERNILLPEKNRFQNGKSVNVNNLQIFFPLITDSNGNLVEGDSMIILFPNDEVMIIDGFYSSAADNYIHFLKEDLKIEKIDYLVVSHFHGDHIGSFSKIFDSFSVKNFYTNGAQINTSASKNFINKINELGINEIVLKQGDILEVGDVRIDVLWPSLTEEDLYKIYYEPGKTAEIINLSSLVFKMTYKDFSILFTGDIYKKGEKQLVKQYGDFLKSTILKAPHHGDPYTSNSRKFLITVNPMLTIAQRPDDFLFFTKIRFFSLNKQLIRAKKPGFIKLETTGFGYSVSEFIRG